MIAAARAPATDARQGNKGSRAGGAVALAAAGALAWAGGLVGAVGGAGLLAAWLATTPRYAFAVGQFGVVAVAGGDPAIAWPLAAAQALVLAVLLAPASGDVPDRWRLGGAVVAGAGFGAAAWWSYAAWEALWRVALVVLGLGALCAYGAHRYELVALGRVTRE